ncbi:MAG: prepilin-type N-terminal cleavage/methylation domain-containing protein [Gammaproteobacteria bacterium]|nr:prepilin-type N-terminal cleavage/methylation domain-containing protein [Gammaproteobacteria bacterium]
MQRRAKQAGFTLVEIAIVLVIIGLLLGGILKGQELINSARVRNMADMNAGIQAAYYGFIDRFRRVPGDWSNTPATAAIGVTINGGGNDNGRIDNGQGGTPIFAEANAMWEQLSKAGFIQGSYNGSAATPTTNSGQTPLNAFNNVVLLGRTADYLDETTAAERLNLVLGRGIPVDIGRELDVKLDDGIPETGVLRLTTEVGGSQTFGGLAASSASPSCSSGAAGNRIYDIANDSQDCNTAFLY